MFEDTKEVIRCRASEKVRTTQWPNKKEQTTIYKTLKTKD